MSDDVQPPSPRSESRRDPPALGLSRYLDARLGPLAVLLFAVVSISAPVAYQFMGTGTVRANAEASARQLALIVRDAAEVRPMLWRYEASALLSNVRAHVEDPAIVRIDILDAEGRAIDVGAPAEATDDGLLWTVEPVRINDDHVADVWIGATVEQVERQATLLLIAFGLLGLVLAGLMFWIPSRAMRSAEGQIVGLFDSLQRSRKALASLNANLEVQVAERSSQLAAALTEVKDLSRRAVRMQEAERRALSRELHDSAGQTLTAVRINLQLIAQHAAHAEPDRPVDPDRLGALATRTIEVADRTLEEIRRVVDRLAPSILDDMGLQAAIEQQCEDASERMEVEVDADVEVPQGLGTAAQIACYRLVQESLTNVARHADASRIEVRVAPQEDGVHIEVSDDGKGFDVQEAMRGDRRGLRGMRERVELIGGTLVLNSSPGHGTRMRAHIRGSVGQ